MTRAKKLKMFNCHLNISVMVVAEDEAEARSIASNVVEEELGNMSPLPTDFASNEAHTGRHRIYADGWSGEDCPYGQSGSPLKTVDECFQIIEKGQDF